MTKIKVWILSGVSGCGKSTFTNALKSALENRENNMKINICSTDSFIDDYCKENNMKYQEAYQEIQEKKLFRNATAKFYADIEDSLKNDTNFVIDRTNLTSGGRKFLIENLRDTAKVIGKILDVRIVFFNVPREILLRRNESRMESEGKFIPLDVLESQMESLENVKHDEGHNSLSVIDESEHDYIENHGSIIE